MPSEIAELQELLRDFARKGEWEQFHPPKTLPIALAAEAGGLLEPFQWLTPKEAQLSVIRGSGHAMWRTSWPT